MIELRVHERCRVAGRPLSEVGFPKAPSWVLYCATVSDHPDGQGGSQARRRRRGVHHRGCRGRGREPLRHLVFEPEGCHQGERRCDPGPRAGAPGPPRAPRCSTATARGSFLLPATLMVAMASSASASPAPGPRARVRVEQGCLPLRNAGLDARCPARRHASSRRGHLPQPPGLELRGDERVHDHGGHAARTSRPRRPPYCSGGA